MMTMMTMTFYLAVMMTMMRIRMQGGHGDVEQSTPSATTAHASTIELHRT